MNRIKIITYAQCLRINKSKTAKTSKKTSEMHANIKPK